MEHYEETLKALKAELAELESQRAKLEARFKEGVEAVEKRMTHVKGGIVSISRLLDVAGVAKMMHEAVNAPVGLTEGIREVLKASTSPLTPPEIREALEGIGYDIAQHSNPLASIHSCLRRLTSRGEALSFDLKGKTVYEWKR